MIRFENYLISPDNNISMDITAPLYWWADLGNVHNLSMKPCCFLVDEIIAEKEFTMDDFSCEHLDILPIPGNVFSPQRTMEKYIEALEVYRKLYLQYKDEKYLWQVRQLLPISYNHKQRVYTTCDELIRLCVEKEDSKLDEWQVFRNWVKNTMYSYRPNLYFDKEVKDDRDCG